MEQVRVGGVALIPVAAPTHPLAKNDSNPPGAARDHVQLVLADRSTLTEGKDFGVVGVRSWRLADLGSKHALLVAGIGWGSMPEPMVRADLEAGRLRHLELPEWSSGFYAMQAIYRTEAPPVRRQPGSLSDLRSRRTRPGSLGKLADVLEVELLKQPVPKPG